MACVSPILVIISHFSHTSLIVLTLHLAIIPMLVGWRLSIIFITAGISLAYSIYQIFIHDYIASDIEDLKTKLIYVLIKELRTKRLRLKGWALPHRGF